MKHVVMPALLLVLLVVAGSVESVAQLSGGSGGPSGASPDVSLPPENCFDVFLGNVSFCKSLHCTTRWFGWFHWLRCEEAELAGCLADAKALFEECLAGQGC